MFWFYAKLNYFRIKLLNKIYGNIKVSIYIYTILKYVFKEKPLVHTAILKLATILISPVVFTTIWLLKLLKFIITCWVAYIDPNYVAMLDGTESIFIGQGSDESRPIMTTLFLLEDKENAFSGDDFYNFCVSNISRIFAQEKFLKLNCSVQYKFGYYYLKREERPITAYFKKFKPNSCDDNMNSIEHKMALTMEQLREFVSEVSNQQMPENDDCLWEARVSRQKLEGTNLFPVILRFNHIFGDAITLFNMFSSDFQKNYKSTKTQNLECEVRSLNATYTKQPFITMNGLIDPPDSNVLCQTNGDKHIVWFTEETPEILQTIKEVKMKQKLLNNQINVVDVILTCFLESLSTHFEKLNVELPSEVYTVLPMMPPHIKYNAYGRVANYEMTNKISIGFLRLPMKLDKDQKENSLFKRLNLIKHEYNTFKNVSLDYWCNRWQGTVVLTLLPWFLQKWFITRYGISLMVSNIPGCDSLEFFGRLKVKDFVFIDPNTSISGVSLMITSYEKRLNFAYTIDKAVIPKVEDVKHICADFLKNLEKLRQNSC